MNLEGGSARRTSPRLASFDYAQERYYFITVCIRNGECLLGSITNGDMTLNAWGEIVTECWHDLSQHYKHSHQDGFVVMPNHIHGIISIHGDVRREARPTLSEVAGGFKSFSTRRINQRRNTSGQSIWQRSFHDHIIRNDADLERIREYIENNPSRWAEDRFYT